MVDNGTGYLLTADSMRDMWEHYLSGGADRDCRAHGSHLRRSGWQAQMKQD